MSKMTPIVLDGVDTNRAIQEEHAYNIQQLTALARAFGASREEIDQALAISDPIGKEKALVKLSLEKEGG